MSEQIHSAKQEVADHALEVVHDLEELRASERAEGGTMLAEYDRRLAAARAEACRALLAASIEARDAGELELARTLLERYGRQEHLAARARGEG